MNSGWSRTIGVVGGLGPHAHVRFEELLLRATEERAGALSGGLGLRDQDYPPYVVASLPGTPDRTDFVLGKGPSPMPWLERSLRALRGSDDGIRADFAVIACNAAHALVPELRELEILPILSLVDEVALEVGGRGDVQTVGVLATTGTLEAQIYQRAFDGQGLTAVGLSDLPGGSELQRTLVMDSIYGGTDGPGIKSAAHLDKRQNARLFDNFERAVGRLAEAGANLVLIACTEIPLVLRPGFVVGVEVIDPLEIAAQAALSVAAGEREADPRRVP